MVTDLDGRGDALRHRGSCWVDVILFVPRIEASCFLDVHALAEQCCMDVEKLVVRMESNIISTVPQRVLYPFAPVGGGRFAGPDAVHRRSPHRRSAPLQKSKLAAAPQILPCSWVARGQKRNTALTVYPAASA